MGQRKRIAIYDVTQAIEQNCSILLRLPEDREFSLFSCFNIMVTEGDLGMRQVKNWLSDRYKGNAGQVYADIKTDNWTDFQEKWDRIQQARKLQNLYVVYAGRVTNAMNFMATNTLFQDLQQNRDTDVLYHDQEKTVGFPRWRGKAGIAFPFIEAAQPQTLQWKDIEIPPSEPYQDYQTVACGR